MSHPIIDQENGKIRYNEMLKQAEQYRQARKITRARTFRLPKLRNLFAGRKSEESTAVVTQAR